MVYFALIPPPILLGGVVVAGGVGVYSVGKFLYKRYQAQQSDLSGNFALEYVVEKVKEVSSATIKENIEKRVNSVCR